MAAPHVSGVVARMLGVGECGDPACVAAALTTQSVKSRVGGSLRSSPNRLIHRERNV
jgi:hypothetical protein